MRARRDDEGQREGEGVRVSGLPRPNAMGGNATTPRCNSPPIRGDLISNTAASQSFIAESGDFDVQQQEQGKDRVFVLHTPIPTRSRGSKKA